MKISRNRLRRIIREQLLTEQEASPEEETVEVERETEEPAAEPEEEEEAPLRGRQRRLARRAGRKGGRARGATGDRRASLEAEVEELEAEIEALENPPPTTAVVRGNTPEGEDPPEVTVTEIEPDDDEEEFTWDKTTWTVDDNKWPLTQGEHGDAVKKLQVAVGVEPDGYYGDVTATAVDKYVEGNGETVTAEEHAKLLETQPGKGGSGGAPAEAEAEAEEAEEEAGDLLDQAADLAISAAGGGERSEAMWDAGRENMDSATDLGGFLRGVADKGVEFLGDEASKKMSALADQAEDVAQDAIDDAEDFISDKIDGGLSEARHRRQRTLRNRHSGGTVSRAQIRSMILREMLKRQ